MYERWHTLQHLKMFETNTRVAVWCKTVKLAREFVSVVKKNGVNDSCDIVGGYNTYGSETCLVSDGYLMKGPRDYCEKNNYMIIEFCGDKHVS